MTRSWAPSRGGSVGGSGPDPVSSAPSRPRAWTTTSPRRSSNRTGGPAAAAGPELEGAGEPAELSVRPGAHRHILAAGAFHRPHLPGATTVKYVQKVLLRFLLTEKISRSSLRATRPASRPRKDSTDGPSFPDSGPAPREPTARRDAGRRPRARRHRVRPVAPPTPTPGGPPTRR